MQTYCQMFSWVSDAALYQIVWQEEAGVSLAEYTKLLFKIEVKN